MSKKKQLRKLVRLVKKLGISIRKIDDDWMGSNANAWAKQQYIKLGTDGKITYVIGALAHELGHCLSVRLKSHINSLMNMRYKVRSSDMTKEELSLIIMEEKRAWLLGFRFMSENGIRVTKKMKLMKRDCVRSHVRNIKNSFNAG